MPGLVRDLEALLDIFQLDQYVYKVNTLSDHYV